MKNHVPKTTICVIFGLSEFSILHFGLCNTAETFQRFMNAILCNIPFCFVYLDDILIFSQNEAEHKVNLRMLFEILNAYELAVNP